MGIKDTAKKNIEKVIATLPFAFSRSAARFVRSGSDHNVFVRRVAEACGAAVLRDFLSLPDIVSCVFQRKNRSEIDRSYAEVAVAVSLTPDELAAGILKPAFDMMSHYMGGRTLQDAAHQKKFIECVVDSFFCDAVPWIEDIETVILVALNDSKNTQDTRKRAVAIVNKLIKSVRGGN